MVFLRINVKTGGPLKLTSERRDGASISEEMRFVRKEIL